MASITCVRNAAPRGQGRAFSILSVCPARAAAHHLCHLRTLGTRPLITYYLSQRGARQSLLHLSIYLPRVSDLPSLLSHESTILSPSSMGSLRRSQTRRLIQIVVQSREGTPEDLHLPPHRHVQEPQCGGWSWRYGNSTPVSRSSPGE